jgi:RNA polymerase sigma-70 factor (ECF subfamily)
MKVSDQQLLALIASGDRAAFAEFYDRFAPRIFGLLLRLVHHRADAEEVLQEVFLHAWRNAKRYDPRLSEPAVWLMLTARSRAIDALRKRASQVETVESSARATDGRSSSQAQPADDDLMRWRRVSQAMTTLPSEQSDAISLAFHGGMSCAQIAALRGVPIGTVKTRIRLGMIKLRDAVASGARTFRTSEVAS